MDLEVQVPNNHEKDRISFLLEFCIDILSKTFYQDETYQNPGKECGGGFGSVS